MSTDAATGVSEFVAYYRFNSPTHSFTALSGTVPSKTSVLFVPRFWLNVVLIPATVRLVVDA
jgi:hypothetical protein